MSAPRAVCDMCCRPYSRASCFEHPDVYRYGDEPIFAELGIEPDDECHDCGVGVGGWHHACCAVERCMICDDQALFCDHHAMRVDAFVLNDREKKRTRRGS